MFCASQYCRELPPVTGRHRRTWSWCQRGIRTWNTPSVGWNWGRRSPSKAQRFWVKKEYCPIFVVSPKSSSCCKSEFYFSKYTLFTIKFGWVELYSLLFDSNLRHFNSSSVRRFLQPLTTNKFTQTYKLLFLQQNSSIKTLVSFAAQTILGPLSILPCQGT